MRATPLSVAKGDIKNKVETINRLASFLMNARDEPGALPQRRARNTRPRFVLPRARVRSLCTIVTRTIKISLVSLCLARAASPSVLIVVLRFAERRRSIHPSIHLSIPLCSRRARVVSQRPLAFPAKLESRSNPRSCSSLDRWRLDIYIDVIARTRLINAYTRVTAQDTLSRGYIVPLSRGSASYAGAFISGSTCP